MVIVINNLTQWKHLPWAKIYNNVSRLQKYIYKASKECDKYSLSKLQKYMVESSDAKIVAIQQVLNCTYNSCLYWKHRKYHFNDKDKFFIYRALYGTLVIDSEIDDIVKQIKKYIVYMCIKPELSAKSTRFSKGKIKVLKNAEINDINQIFEDLNVNYVLNDQLQALLYIQKNNHQIL